MLLLVIKGTLQDASREAEKHGVTLWNARQKDSENPTRSEVYAQTPADSWREVCKWFQETELVPFPPGALLHYHFDPLE